MRIPFWATIFMLISVMILCALGLWQVDRLAWKQGIIAAIQEQQSIDPTQNHFTPDDLAVDHAFKRGTITGHFLHDKEIHLAPRMYDSIVGYHLFTPFKLAGDEGRILLVNRGWVPNTMNMPEGSVIEFPAGEVSISGTIRKPAQANAFTPENHPDDGVWYHIDLGDVSKALGLTPVFPVMFYADNSGLAGYGADDGRYPLPVLVNAIPNNNHKQYAFFWFSMALVLVVVYGLRFIVPQLKKQ